MPHFMRDIQTFGGLAIHQKPVITAPTALPVVIQVDPVAGSDDLSVDGISSPVKTIEAAFKRVVDIRTYTSGDDGIPFDFGPPVVISLLPGVHSVGSVLYNYRFIEMGNITIRGAWQDITTFTVDSIAGEGCRISKPISDPAWVVDELVGKWVEYEPWPSLYPGYMVRNAIMANTSHEVTIAWSLAPPEGWSGGGYPAPPISSTLKIRDLASQIVGPEQIWAVHAGFVEFRDVVFNAANSTPPGYLMFFASEGLFYFWNCKFDGTGGTYPLNLQEKASALVYNCLFYNCGTGLSVFAGARLQAGECCYINCGRAFMSYFSSMLMSDWDVIHARNTSIIYYARGDSRIDALTFAIHAIDCGTIVVLQDNSTFTISGDVYNRKVVDGKAPNNYVTTYGPNCKATFRPRFTDTTYPTNGAPANKPISIGNNTPDTPVAMTWDDLYNLYYNHYVFGYGCEIINGA